MTVPTPASRFLYTFDGNNNLGVDLTGTASQVGEWAPGGIEEALVDTRGSHDSYPQILPAGFSRMGDFTVPLWANSTIQGLLDDIHGVTAADRSDSRIVVWGWRNGADIGDLFEAATVYEVNVTPSQPPEGLTSAVVMFRPTTQFIVNGIILHNLSEETADGDTTASSVDGSASSSDGGTGVWGYTTLNLDSGTDFLPRVVDSADNIAFGALVTFTAVTATTGGGEVKAVTGTVERYIACDWDFTGTPGGSAAATFFIGFERN